MRRTELSPYTAEQVAGHLDEAYRIVAESGLHPELHAAVLPQVLRLLAAKQIVLEQVDSPAVPSREIRP